MKTRLTFWVLPLLIVSFNFGLARQPQQNSNSCGFAVQGEPSQPTVKGPDDIVPLVYVVEQPDSPVEVVSVDLTVSHEQHAEQDCAKYRIRNRSDRTVQEFEVMLMLSTIAGAGGGSGTVSPSPLPPGQAVDVESCGIRGKGSAKGDYACSFTWIKLISTIVITNHPLEFRAASRCIPCGKSRLRSRRNVSSCPSNAAVTGEEIAPKALNCIRFL
jgi:hypothetical protein